MCGILFVKSIKNKLIKKEMDETLLLMETRGPDQWGSFLNNSVYLGHRRLSILDLSPKGRQPFKSSKGDFHIIYNGEIYNYQELKERFQIKTNSNSDTEVLIELYQKLGARCLEYLNGMFSFVIYNENTGEIFAARDRLGIKPLYWYNGEDYLIFSSEISPILNIIKYIEPDEVGIRQYMKARTTFRGHTIYKNIKLFPAGHYYNNGNISKYWDLTPVTECWKDEEIAELLDTAVQYRLIADVPVGSYLSGGLDSTIITAIAKTKYSYTVGFKSENEFNWSERAAKHIGTKHIEVTVTDDIYIETMKEMIRKRKEPLSVPNEVLIYLMTKEVKKNNTVVLSGEGADELFFGYDRIFRWAENSEWDIKEFDKYYSYGRHEDYEILQYILEPYLRRNKALNIVESFFQISHLSGLLRRLDYCTMLASVEARVPFVDHRIVQYMHGAPMSYRMQNGVVKAPLKRIYKDILPKEILHRKKVGFPVPLARMFNARSQKEAMEQWLDLNMSTLFPDWREIRLEIFSMLKDGGLS